MHPLTPLFHLTIKNNNPDKFLKMQFCFPFTYRLVTDLNEILPFDYYNFVRQESRTETLKIVPSSYNQNYIISPIKCTVK